jgi:hypothetical protein
MDGVPGWELTEGVLAWVGHHVNCALFLFDFNRDWEVLLFSARQINDV